MVNNQSVKSGPSQGSDTQKATALSQANVVLTDGTQVDHSWATANPHVRYALKEVRAKRKVKTGKMTRQKVTVGDSEEDKPWPDLEECFIAHLPDDLKQQVRDVVSQVDGADWWMNQYGIRLDPYTTTECPVVKGLKEAPATLRNRPLLQNSGRTQVWHNA